MEVDDRGLWAFEGKDGGVVSDRGDATVTDGQGLNARRRPGPFVGTEVCAGEDVSVDEENIGRWLVLARILGLDGRRRGGETAEAERSTKGSKRETMGHVINVLEG